MASIKRYIKLQKKAPLAVLGLRIVLGLGKRISVRVNTGIDMEGVKLKETTGAIVLPRANPKEALRLRQLEERIVNLERHLVHVCYNTPVGDLTVDFLKDVTARHLHPERFSCEEAIATKVEEAIAAVINTKGLSESRNKMLRALGTKISRFERYRHIKATRAKALTLDNFSEKELQAFHDYLAEESQICAEHPELVKKGERRVSAKGANAITDHLKMLRSVFNHAIRNGWTTNYPFARYQIKTAVYGTPVCLSKAERDQIADLDLSFRPALERQRDIFIFQCLIGCRVGDLMRLTPSNVICRDGRYIVEYVANKTRDHSGATISVPLSARAVALVKKYEGVDDGGRLLPFISEQRYNDSIKEVMALAGVTRMVTILNPTTRREEQQPINKVASSHMARRTFIHILRKAGVGLDVIGKMSGHVDGSKEIARYYAVDDDMKSDVIALID